MNDEIKVLYQILNIYGIIQTLLFVNQIFFTLIWTIFLKWPNPDLRFQHLGEEFRKTFIEESRF